MAAVLVALVAVVVSPLPLFDAPCCMSVAVVCTVLAPPEEGATTTDSRYWEFPSWTVIRILRAEIVYAKHLEIAPRSDDGTQVAGGV